MSEAAKIWGTSKQSVSRMVRDGKITLGADGLLNLEQATRQYIAGTNPSKIRARLLAPLVRDLQAAQAREAAMKAQIEQLRGDLDACEDDRDFHEAAASEFCAQARALALAVRDLWVELDELEAPARADFLGRLPDHLIEEWDRLSGLPSEQRLSLIWRALQEKDGEGQPADPDDFLAAVDASPKAPNPPIHDEDEDHDDHP